MSRTSLAFGIALIASLAFAALGAVSASALSMTPTPVSFAGPGGVLGAAAAGRPIKSCTSSQSSGKALTDTTGEIKLTLKGCTRATAPSGTVPCTTSGQASGTIVTGNLKYSLVYLDAAKTKFGLMLIPPNAGVYKELPPPFDTWNGKVIPGSGTFAQFACGPFSYTWKGSVLGQITSPALGVSSAGATLSFTTSGSTQTYRQVEGAGFNYQLSELEAGGSTVDLGIEATNSMNFAENVKFLP